MSINKDAYLFTLEYMGVKEIEGPQDNPMIEVAHQLTKYESEKGAKYSDEVPWCSSWVVLALVCAAIRRNPKAAYDMLKGRGHSDAFISKVFAYAKVSFEYRTHNTGTLISRPTFSASSLSWDKWGEAVDPKNAKRGDLVRFTRNGGGHIAFLDEDSMGRLFVRVLGGNQSNMVCSSNSYARLRVVHVRRSNI